jgi:two-component system, NarL family, invasion response regulator UvrY
VIRILIVDDHDVVRRGIQQIVADSPGMVLAGEAASGAEALDLARGEAFDVAIVDIAMPGRGGLEILKELRAARPGLKIIVLSMYPEEQYAVRSLREGASAYLTKANVGDELVAAVHAVAAGRRYITASVAERLATYIEEERRSLPHESLSDRELQVLVMIASGKTTGDISRELSLSVKTVSTYRARVLEKMVMTTNAQLIRYAVEHGLT